MSIDFARTDQEEISNLHISGTLDADAAPQLRPCIDKLIAERRPHVVVDLAGLVWIDKIGVAELASLNMRLRQHGGQMQIVNAQVQPMAIFKELRWDKALLS